MATLQGQVGWRARLIPARRSSRDWPRRYGSWLIVSDVAVVVATLAVYRLVAIPPGPTRMAWSSEGPFLSYTFGLIITAALWLAALALFETRERHIVGSGPNEYRRVANASFALFALLVSICFFFQIDAARTLFLVALPIGTLVLIFSRWAWRQWLRTQQRGRKYVYRTVVMAEPGKAAHVIESIDRSPGTGFDVVGVVTSRQGDAIGRVPILGGFSDAVRAIDLVDADTLIIAGADELDPRTMRRIGWEVADRDVDLVVAPALTDVAGPRIHATPAAGLPFIHVEFPRLEGFRRFAKRAFDLVASFLLIAILSPIMIATAIAVRVDSRGPIFYRQVRIGRGGREFGMIKFRSMNADADDQLASLLDLQGTSDQPLFKVTDDPRITRVGRFLRKHSIDELPQLFNVLTGDMSLVGPRPQREGEVALYDDAAHRRLLVKPGMSGLWQVSGRSALSWDDAVRLDLYYVENWSFVQDIQILFRTFRAVLAPGESAH
ncbi:hypothetical protein MICABA_02525 [Microbacterium sp. T2.11-28]|nr:hypothetical protein MICABA_02525 [Microbacterium sp. T2.11-28]